MFITITEQYNVDDNDRNNYNNGMKYLNVLLNYNVMCYTSRTHYCKTNAVLSSLLTNYRLRLSRNK